MSNVLVSDIAPVRQAVSPRSGLARRLAAGRFVTCVEIVPPRGCDPASAVEGVRRLERRGVDAVNIPDGPRACARMSPMALAAILAPATRLEIVLHCNCRDRNLLGMQSDLLGLSAQNIRNLLIVTGDPPRPGEYPEATAVYDVDSVGLTRVVGALNRGLDIAGRLMDAPTSFFVGVAVNPGAVPLDREVERLEAKAAAGAEFAVTQPVFEVGLLEEFLKRVSHLRLPVLAGIWPLRSVRNALFLKNDVPGSAVPDAVIERMRRAQDESLDGARREGVAIAREILAAVRSVAQGVQICPPPGKCEVALDVLEAL